MAALIGRTFQTETTHIITAAEIAACHRAWLARVGVAGAVDRLDETHERNTGLAILEGPSGPEPAE